MKLSSLLQHSLSKIYIALLLTALTVSTQAVAQATSFGYSAEAIEVNVYDRKLDKQIRLNTQLIAPAAPPTMANSGTAIELHRQR